MNINHSTTLDYTSEHQLNNQSSWWNKGMYFYLSNSQIQNLCLHIQHLHWIYQERSTCHIDECKPKSSYTKAQNGPNDELSIQYSYTTRNIIQTYEDNQRNKLQNFRKNKGQGLWHSGFLSIVDPTTFFTPKFMMSLYILFRLSW